MLAEDMNNGSNEASEEDYNIRSLTTKLGIRDQFPQKISSRW